MYLNISCDKLSGVGSQKQSPTLAKQSLGEFRMSIQNNQHTEKITYESMRKAKLTSIFKDIQESLQEGREVKLKGIGIKETPYNKLLMQLERDKQIIKRKDFIESLEKEK